VMAAMLAMRKLDIAALEAAAEAADIPIKP
jgi:hypothetical protein